MREVQSNSNKNIARIAFLTLVVMSLLFSCVFLSFNFNETRAYTSGSTPASIGSLTFSNYDTRSDGQVFDPVVLNKFYDKVMGSSYTGKATYKDVYDKVNASQSVVSGGKSGEVITQPKSLDYSALSGGTTTGPTSNPTKTAPDPIIVEFGGMEWAAVYLSENTTMTTGGKPDLVLTLLATKESANAYQFGVHRNGYTIGGYSGNIYSTSYIRAAVLNGGGDSPINYSTNNPKVYPGTSAAGTYRTGTVNQSDRIASQYAQFTLSDSIIQKKSLTDYLVAPKYMELQKAENTSRVYTNACSNCQGEAWGTGTDGVSGPYLSSWHSYLGDIYDVSKYPQYYEWKDDYLWLPSIAEIGFYMGANNATHSYWGIPFNDSLLDNDSGISSCWTRSGDDRNHDNVVSWCGTFSQQNTSVCTLQKRIRPALHLNLTKATAAILDLPAQTESATYTYSGVEQTIDLKTFMNFDENKMYVSNIAKKVASAGTVNPEVDTAETDATKRTKVNITDAGTYVVTLKAKTGTIDGTANSQYFWSERTPTNDPTETKIEFVVKKKQLTVPTITTTDATKTYDGSKLSISITGYPNDKVTDTANPATFAYPKDPMSVTVTAKRGTNNYTPDYAVVTTTSADGGGTLTIEFRDAADYTVTFGIADAVNYEWSDAATNTDATRTATFKVKPKQLTFTYESDYKAGTADEDKTVLSWAASDNYKATFTVEEIYHGTDTDFPNADNVAIQLKLGKQGDTSFSATVDGTFDATTGKFTAVLDNTAFPSAKYALGVYIISFDFKGTNVHNGNYSFSDALTAWNNKALTITAAGAGLTNYKFKFTTKKDDATDTDGTNGTVTAPATDLPTGNKIAYSYDSDAKKGFVYEINVDTTDFADAHIQIDLTRGAEGFINGYKNQRASKAGKYKTIVALVTTDDAYLFQKDDGTTSKTLEVEFEWEITKLTVDLDGVSWQYTGTDGATVTYAKWDKTANGGSGAWVYADGDGGFGSADKGLPWKSGNYTLKLGDLPSGVTVKNGSSYSGNQQKYVGSGYVAKVSGSALVYDKDNYNTISIPDLSWSIVKAKVVLGDDTWDSDETKQGDDDKIFYLPHLISPYDGTGIEYEIYDLGTSEPFAKPGTLITLDDVEVVPGTVHKYYVKPKFKDGLSPDGVTKWSEALMFVDADGNELHDTVADLEKLIKEFETGDNRTPVQVTGTFKVTYDGKAHGTLVESGEGDIEVKVGENTFDDVRLRWYNYDASAGDSHKGTELSEAPIAAGKYIIEVELKESAAEDYVLIKKTITFEIEKYKFDMSGVKWGYLSPKVDDDGNPVLDGNGNPVMEEVEYNPSMPFEFKVKVDESGKPVLDENGKPVAEEQELVIIGLPKGDANGDDEAKLLHDMFEASGLSGNEVFTLGGNKASAVTPTGGTNTATYVLDMSKLGDNFDLTGMPSATDFPSSLNWRIESKKLKKPQDNGDLVFCGEALDLLGAAGLDATGLNVYYKITGITYISPKNVPSMITPDDVKTQLNAGEYRITVTLTDSANLKWDDNGLLKTSAQTFAVTVKKLKLIISDWDGDGKEPWSPLFGEDGTAIVPDVWEIILRDGDGNVVDGDGWQTKYNETFKQTLAAKEGNEDNIEFEYKVGVDSEKEFTTGDDPGSPALPIAKPGFTGTVNGDGAKEETYTGKPIDFTPNGLGELLSNGSVKLYVKDGDGNETEVTASYFTQTNGGTYTVYVRPTSSYKWIDTNDRSDAVYTFVVNPVEVTVEWSVDENGKPVAKLPAEFATLEDVFDYHYYDENGTEVNESDLSPQTEYTVKVSLKDAFANNLTLVGADAKNEVESETKYLTPITGFLGFLMQPFWFGLNLWIWLLIFLSILLLLILLIVFIVRHRKKKAERQAKTAEREEAEEEKRRAREEEKERREEERRRREEEREEERRRREEERRERYAIQGMAMPMQGIGMPMSQPQAQPQPMPQPQAQPMPQPAQSYTPQSTGTNDEAIARMEAKFEQMMNEQMLARARAEAKAEAQAEATQQSLVMQIAAMERTLAEVKAEATERSRAELQQQLNAARMENEIMRMRGIGMTMPSMSDGSGTEMLGGMLMAALQKYATEQGLPVLSEERPALAEGKIVNNVVPGAITTTTTTTTVDASGRGEENKGISGETLPSAEGLFNRRGRNKADGYDVDNFYNFFDEQDKDK